MTGAPAPDEVTISTGLPPALRHEAAELFWEAFGTKFERALGPRARGIALIERNLREDRAIVAITRGELVGLASFERAGSTFVDLSLRKMVREFGPIRGAWRAALLALLDQSSVPGELLMDGIAVRGDMRSRGIGTRLIHAMFDCARESGLDRVRLEVVDENPRAQDLYEREGFLVVRHERTPYLRRLIGVGGYSEMVARVPGR